MANLGSNPHSVPWWEDAYDDDPTDIARVVAAAGFAEQAGFDALFKADFIGFNASLARRNPKSPFDPAQLCAVVAAQVPRIAVIPTVSVLFTQPYNVARQLVSLDWIAQGRLAWNLVTSFNGERNYGFEELPAPDVRYRQAAEFHDVVRALWASWPPEASRPRRESREYVDLERIQAIDHVGEFYRVEGPLDLPVRTAELPILVQAGASPEGIDSAVRQADAVFAAAPSFEHGRALKAQIRERAVRAGRDPESLRVIFGVRIVAAATDEAAWEQLRTPLTDEQLAAARASVERELDGIRLSDVGWDDALPADRFAEFRIEELGRRRSRAEIIRNVALEQPWTMREFLTRSHHHGSHLNVIGAYDRVADELERWHAEDVADGFILVGDTDIDVLAQEVLPRLRRRHVLSDAAAGASFRAALGLATG